MSNLVLYRKYRPQKFSELIGQEHVATVLLNAIEQDRVAHAYLFSGPRGSGKTTVARLLAKAVNCESKDSPEPCNKCASCLEIISGKAMDIVEIDAASHRGIDEIRELREGVRFSPSKLKKKVFILDEAHQLTSGAANALLKMLEESPEHVIFVLATTEPQKMIPTIISRCQRFDFRKISVEGMIKRMEGILKKEGVSAKKDVLLMVAASAGGSLRDAESMLSQIISFASKDGVIEKEDVKNLLGIVEREVVGNLIDFLLKKDAVKSLELLENAAERGSSPEGLHEGVMSYLRDMMILKIISHKEEDSEETSLMSSLLAKFTKEEVARIKEQIKETNTQEIKMMIDSFYGAGERIKYSPIPQLPLEVAIAEITDNLRKEEK